MNFRLSLGRCHGWMRENGNSCSAWRRTFHDATQSKAVASYVRLGTLAKLSDDAHFPGSILANANRLVPIYEFPPAPVPINHGHKTGEGGRNRLRVAILHPDTEPRRMFSFIDARGWFAHFIRSSGAVAALSLAHRHCPSEEGLPKRM
jgi:hypothetical protein